MDKTKELKKSLEPVADFFKNKKVQNILVIALLLAILVLGSWIRIQNIPALKDQTTGEYIPLALDPYYFLRVAETLVENNGELPQYDDMRDPMIKDTKWHPEILPQTIVSIYKINKIFNEDATLRFADIIYPVIFFLLGTLVFFFLISFLTKNKWLALTSSALLSVMPGYIYRTLAGFSDHEAIGMFSFFLGILGFGISMKYLSKNKKKLIYSGILGLITGILMTLSVASWGGIAKILFMIIPLCFLGIWIFNFRKRKSLKNYVLYYLLIIPGIILGGIILGYPLNSLIQTNLLTALGIFTPFVLGYVFIDFIAIKYFKEKIPEKIKKYQGLFVTLITLSLGAIFYQIFVGNFGEILKFIFERLIYPFGTERVGLTVAENRQPYLTEWINQIGKYVFWAFVLGCILVGTKIGQGIKKNKLKYLFIFSWIIFISGILFTRISQNSLLNGTNFFSKALFFIGFLFFIIVSIYTYLKSDWKINYRGIIILAWMIPMLIAVRGAIRLFFAIIPFATFIAIFGVFDLTKITKKTKDELFKMLGYIITLILIILLVISFVNFTKSTVQNAANYSPSANGDWQKAMKWVRENTNERDTFLHWWDYGYWVQTLGERPTFSDGGHAATSYGDHLVARYVLTTPNPDSAKSFMKSNNISYFLIDPTDIGKYTAYSSIGSDDSGKDRYSFLSTMISDPSQIQETRDGIVRIYQGGIPTDIDVYYEDNGTEIFLPAEKSALGGIILEKKNTGNFSQPQGVFYYNGNQYKIPLRYLFSEGKLIDFESGLNSTVYKYPRFVQNNQEAGFDEDGAIIYLSEKTKDSLVVQVYLMGDPNNLYPELKLAHIQGIYDFNFYYQGFRGPIKIWKVGELDDYLAREEFLERYGGFGEFDDLDFVRN